MKPINKIWLNGKIVPLEKASFLNFHQGLNYGACVYEGIRFYKTKKGSAIFRLKAHLDRFFYSASVLNMDLGVTKNNFAKAIINLIRVNKATSGYIRPIAFYSEPKMGINIVGAKLTVMVLIWPWQDSLQKKSVKMKIVKIKRLDPATVDLKAKISGYYANGLLGFLEARRAGFDEPLFLDVKGFVAEGAVNNIFIIKNNILYTPKLKNILGGITRDSIIQIARDLKIKVYEKNIRPDFMRQADDIFLTGTGIELEYVTKIDRYFSKNSAPSPVFNALQEQYRKVVTGSVDKYKNWLTLIK
ncbi:MAG: branched-chain amino acid transaminase [Patescibacteria group bacterium]|nr:branched-chain amino acid transaminase [Patescibacteria group bacterium]